MSFSQVVRQRDSGLNVSILRDDSIDRCKKKLHVNMCLIVKSCRDRAVSISILNSRGCLCVGLGEELSLQKKAGHQRLISYSNCGFCCPHEEQQAIFAHELQSALLTVVFFKVYCEL
jgi:hypothetical protein